MVVHSPSNVTREAIARKLAIQPLGDSFSKVERRKHTATAQIAGHRCLLSVRKLDRRLVRNT